MGTTRGTGNGQLYGANYSTEPKSRTAAERPMSRHARLGSKQVSVLRKHSCGLPQEAVLSSARCAEPPHGARIRAVIVPVPKWQHDDSLHYCWGIGLAGTVASRSLSLCSDRDPGKIFSEYEILALEVPLRQWIARSGHPDMARALSHRTRTP